MIGHLIEVPPLRTETRTRFCFTVSGCHHLEAEGEVYPPSPGEHLAVYRRSLSLSVRDAAEALGISPTELTGLERGRLTLGTLIAWETVAEMLDEASGGG